MLNLLRRHFKHTERKPEQSHLQLMQASRGEQYFYRVEGEILRYRIWRC